ncbi:MAG TPA: hypothetical protein VLN08_13610 [Vicinamibacterales bacterium]|nr:hypothetical protein [Vicinamibacterales bacterium]
MWRRLLPALVVALFAAAASLGAQDPSPAGAAPSAVRVFLDCPSGCDTTYIRKELNFVDHVRDREVADVHILITTQGAGGGGRLYTLSFMGLRGFDGTNDTATFLTLQADTDDDIRRGLVRVLKLGLIRYVTSSSIRDSLEVTYRPPLQQAQAAQTTTDPWNFWVFRVRGNVSTSGEESETTIRLSSSVTASRVTESWKLSASGSGNYRRSRFSFEDEDEEDYVAISRDSSASGLIVKSLGAHWGAGGRVSMATSTYNNQRLTLGAFPAIEYNIYPYDESTRRQLTFTYSLGLRRYNYHELTIYEKTEETAFSHAFAVNWDMQEPWGNLDLRFDATQFIPHGYKYRLAIDGDADVRLFKGFSLSLSGSASRIRNQIYLPAEGATDEEVLLRLRQIATGYDYYFSVGISYTFGSVFNNAVNARLSAF